MIHVYLGRGKIINADKLPPIWIILHEFSGIEEKKLPKKGLLPPFHGSGVTHALASLWYQIGTHFSFDFGDFIFEHMVKHAESYALKLPINLILSSLRSFFCKRKTF